LLPGDPIGAFCGDLMDTTGPGSICPLDSEAEGPPIRLAGRCGKAGCDPETQIGACGELTTPLTANPAKAEITAPLGSGKPEMMWMHSKWSVL